MPPTPSLRTPRLPSFLPSTRRTNVVDEDEKRLIESQDSKDEPDVEEVKGE